VTGSWLVFRTSLKVQLFIYTRIEDKILAHALNSAQGRWNDPDYGTRIVVSQIVGDSWKDTLGFGLSVNHFAMPDYDTIQVVEWHSQSVSTRITSMPSVEVASVPLEHFCLERVG